MAAARPALAELLRRRATSTLLLVSATLSVVRLAGTELAPLLPEYPEWQHQPWRLVTSTWLHVNVIHLFFNLYWLALLGAPIERVLGTLRTAGLYLLLALTSSAAELAFFDGGIGLSGIVYGAFGWLWTSQRSDERYRGVLAPETTRLFVGWFFLCILMTISGTMPVANVAHGAGALVGGLAGWAAHAAGRGRLVRAIPLGLLVVSIALASTLGRPLVKSRVALARESAHAGWKELDQGEWERARRQLEQAVRADPEDGGSWWNLGVALWKLERWDEASQAFERSVALGNRSEEDLRFLAEARSFLASRAQPGGAQAGE
jgi:GlpG protein